MHLQNRSDGDEYKCCSSPQLVRKIIVNYSKIASLQLLIYFRQLSMIDFKKEFVTDKVLIRPIRLEDVPSLMEGAV